MKLILENWRRYLAEQDFAAPEIALHHIDGGNDYQELYLYRLLETEEPEVIGSVNLSRPSKPCIPNTFEVNGIATNEYFRGAGYGRLLYDLAFYVANDIMGFGLTSDHGGSTSDQAKPHWDIENNPNYEKRKTPDGNDEFDYTGQKTPNDYQDDCDAGFDNSPEKMATDHSFMKKNHGKIPGLYKKYKQIHEENKLTFVSDDRIKDFEQKIVDIADMIFDDAISID